MAAKKYYRLLAAVLIICTFLTGCGTRAASVQNFDVTICGAIFGGAADDRISAHVSFDPHWITDGDNTKYNKDLAAFAAILSEDVYFRTKDLDKGTANRVLYEGEKEEEYDITNLLKKAGFTEVEYIETYKAGEYSGDGNDSATLLLAHETVDKKYDLYTLALRGAFSAQEWLSAFDPGCPNEVYTALTGEHPEWTDENAFKGFDVAQNRAMAFADDFIKRHDDPELKNCIFITGHSRGAAIANLIGAKMEDRDDISSCTYAFNSPGVTLDENAGNYRTIFNIFDTNDYYTDTLPFANERFVRYGRDLNPAIAESDEIKGEIAKLKGRDDYACMSAEDKALYAELFGRRFPDRASLYEMTTVTQSFDNKEDALARADECLSLIGSENGLGLGKLCYMEGTEPEEAVVSAENGKYEVSMTYCGGAVLVGYAMSLAYGADVYEKTVKLFEEDTQACEILTLLVNNAAGLKGGHLLANDFVMTRFVQ